MSKIEGRGHYVKEEGPLYYPDKVSEFEYEFQVPAGTSGEVCNRMSIGIAESSVERASALHLLNRRYGWRGYGVTHRIDAGKGTITFAARHEGLVIGTLTLSVDSRHGLGLDATFAEELADIRRNSEARLCELTRFAFDYKGDTKYVLAALFHVIFIYGTAFYDCSDLLIEVNPRHCRFYEMMLGFRKIGDVRHNTTVDAPSRLMHIKVSEIRRLINEGIAGEGDARSLYRYFFQPEEEFEILSRLMGLALDRLPKRVSPFLIGQDMSTRSVGFPHQV